MPILFLIVLIDLIGFGLIIPLLPFYAEHFHASPAEVGLLMATYSLAQFLFAPFWGRLSDRTGRRPVLLITLFGAVASYIWLGFADSLLVLFAARALGGAMAGNISAAFAYTADITTRANRAKGMGIIGAAFGLGFIIGPAIGGILAGPNPTDADFQTPAFVTAGLSLTALLLTAALLKESLSREIRDRLAAKPPSKRWTQFKETLQRPNVGQMIYLSFLATFVFASMESTFAMWSERTYGWGPQQNGYVFALTGVLSATIQGGLIGRLTRRFGESRLIIQGALFLALGVGLIPFSTTLPVLALAMASIGYGFSVIMPSLNSLVTLNAGEEDIGGVIGVSRSATTLARVAGPSCAGFLFFALGKDWPYYTGVIVMLAFAYLGWRAIKSGLLTDSKSTPKNV